MKLIRNAIQTPDGTILESRHRHDYKSHVDANGKTYMVDGGLEYQRSTIHDDQIDLCVTLEDGHEAVREVLEWGTRGKDGRGDLRLVKLKDMETDHIKACLETQRSMYPQIRTAMENELEYRDE